jgi:hypothetical protein
MATMTGMCLLMGLSLAEVPSRFDVKGQDTSHGSTFDDPPLNPRLTGSATAGQLAPAPPRHTFSRDMMRLPRRKFVLQLAGLVPVPFLARRLHSIAVADLDPPVLRTLAAAILPGELGPRGLERTVLGFERWLADYREGAELLHGYGTGELRTAGPSPALRWSTQLRALATAARKRYGRPFEQLPMAERQALVREAFQGLRITGFLQFDRAPHVAAGLLGFFYASPEATDLCYRARIGAMSCRPLDRSPGKPLPLVGAG